MFDVASAIGNTLSFLVGDPADRKELDAEERLVQDIAALRSLVRGVVPAIAAWSSRAVSHFHDVVNERELARALKANAIPIVGRGARLTSSAPATFMIAAGQLVVSGRAFVRAYGGSVHASGTATVLAEDTVRVHVEDDAVVFLAASFGGSVRVGGAARCIFPRDARDTSDFCRMNRISVEQDPTVVVRRGGGRGYVGDVAWYRAFNRRSRGTVRRIPLHELSLSGSAKSLVTRTGMLLDVQMTASREEPRAVTRGSSIITAWGSAELEVTDDAVVTALDSARVVARGRSFVRAFDAAKVEAHDEAVVLASEYSRVIARDASRVETDFWAVVEASDRARVRAFEESTVYASDDVRVEAAGHSVIHATPRVRIAAGPLVTVRRSPTRS